MSISSSTSSGLDSLLLSYYQAQLAASPSAVASTATSSKSATAADDPPWTNASPTQVAEQAKVLSTTNFINTSNVPLTSGTSTDAKTEKDNQSLFSLYNAVSSLSELAQMAQSSTATSGQIVGYNTLFQTGLSQVENYLSSTSFSSFTLQAATPAASVTSTATVSINNGTYSTQQLISNSNINNPVPGLSSSDSFNIAITRNGTTTNVPIDLSQVQGSLTLGNVVNYINSQLSADGFSTRFQETQEGETATSDTASTYGLQVIPGGDETISLSAASTPALYLVGDSGTASATDTTIGSGSTAEVTTTPADQTGRLTKIGNLDSNPSVISSSNQDASTGNTTAAATVVDSSGNVYVLGNATGNIGSEINQGTQDVYLTKYDSAGNVVWQELVGSAGSASGYSMALDPAGGVVISGTSNADLTPTSIGNGNNDSFVASYDASGDQNWIQQIPTLATNQSNAVSVDASGNVYIGGSVSGGVIGAGQTSNGNTDAYLAELDSNGNIVAENQFGSSSGAAQVSATAIGSDGSLYVASEQNGDAVISKYANGDITSAPVWTEDLGALSDGGAISGLAVSGNQVYVSGTTSNANLTAGGQASVAAAATGGTDAFVFNLTDNGSTATANQISYVGASGSNQGGTVTVGPDGTVYLAGTTTGTFAGQTRNVQNVTNAFVSALNPDGSVEWTQQFGGASGQSTGTAVAVDPEGASVLDALGLPQGTVNPNQTVQLSNQTTLNTGDSFQIKIEGVAPRTATITATAGETFDSLATQINAELGSAGKATVSYTGSAQDLVISANPGQTIDLIPGPTDSDALSRLGIAAGTLSAPASTTKSSSSTTSTTSSTSSTTTLPSYGLGLTGGATGPLNISTKTGADLARSQLLSVLSTIQNIYQTTNAAPAAATVGNTTGTASATTTAQLASYNMALSLLGTSGSNALNNIATLIAGGTLSTSTSTSSSSTSILALF